MLAFGAWVILWSGQGRVSDDVSHNLGQLVHLVHDLVHVDAATVGQLKENKVKMLTSPVLGQSCGETYKIEQLILEWLNLSAKHAWKQKHFDETRLLRTGMRWLRWKSGSFSPGGPRFEPCMVPMRSRSNICYPPASFPCIVLIQLLLYKRN